MSNTGKRLSFVQRVIDRLQGGDEGKIKRLQSKSLKLLENTIKAKQDEIDDCNDKLNDIDEEIQDSVHDVKLDKLSSTESTVNYASEYIRNIDRLIVKKQELVEKRQDLLNEIERAELIASFIN